MGYNRNMPPSTVYEYAALLLHNLPRGRYSRGMPIGQVHIYLNQVHFAALDFIKVAFKGPFGIC